MMNVAVNTHVMSDVLLPSRGESSGECHGNLRLSSA